MNINIIKDNKINLKILAETGEKPILFSAGEKLFWDDPHISQKMLEAHLNPDWDAASRKPEIIDATVDWLVNSLILKKGSRILDIGCGPGLYCTRLYRHGLDVTGMDYSRNSIDYAVRYAAENNMDIRYIYQNYLTMDYEEEFDAIFLIFCDLGALSDIDRDNLLQKVHRALKPGGFFVFDVFTKYYRREKPASNWYVSETGFWKPYPHLVLEQGFHYEEENVLLNRYTVMDERGNMWDYRVWDHYYSVESISKVLREQDFKIQEVWSDLTGKALEEEAGTLGVVAVK